MNPNNEENDAEILRKIMSLTGLNDLTFDADVKLFAIKKCIDDGAIGVKEVGVLLIEAPAMLGCLISCAEQSPKNRDPKLDDAEIKKLIATVRDFKAANGACMEEMAGNIMVLFSSITEVPGVVIAECHRCHKRPEQFQPSTRWQHWVPADWHVATAQ